MNQDIATASSLAYFDQVYVVNLEYRLDRRREMQDQLRRLGLSIERPPIRLFSAVKPADAGPFTTRGARGCFMSHLGVLRHAAEAGYQRIALLEDDVEFAPDFEARFARTVDCLRTQDWGMFYGGHRMERVQESSPGNHIVERVHAEVAITTAHFVGFTQPTIGQLATYLDQMLARPAGDPEGGPMHVDGAYSWYRAQHPSCVTLVSETQLAVQRPSRTDIHALKWFDRWPLVRDLAQSARRWRRAG